MSNYTMLPLSLEKAAEVTGGRYVGDERLKSSLITGVKRDNRQIEAGNMFVCFVGEKSDGHSFAHKAYKSGASCCLCSRDILHAEGPYILVASVETALKALAKYYRSLLTIPVIGVTGSVGKTTAKEMTAAVLAEKYNVLKTPENLNNEIGVPLTLLSVCKEHTAAVIEMGISDFGEMARLADMVRPNIVIMTTVGYCHLEKLGDLDGVLKAKSEVFAYMDKDGAAIVSGDSGRLRALDPGMKKITFGLGENNDYRAANIETCGTDSVSCSILYEGGTIHAVIPAFGSHTVLGALPAAAVGKLLGLDDVQIADGLTHFKTVGGRAGIINTGKLRIINDCYNANPNSMRASIKSLGALSGRKVAILGDMKELGENAEQLHYAIGTDTLAEGIDVLVCTGPLAKEICRGNGNCAVWYPDINSLIESLGDFITSGDTVLVKASHSMHFEQIVEALKQM